MVIRGKKPLISGKIKYVLDNCPTGLTMSELSEMAEDGKFEEAMEKIELHIQIMRRMNDIK